MCHTVPNKFDTRKIFSYFLYDQVITRGLILMLTVSQVVSCTADKPRIISTQFSDTQQVMKLSQAPSRSGFDTILTDELSEAERCRAGW